MPYDQTRLALNALAARAMTDGAFRARVIADPHAAAREAGIDLPPAARVRFAEKPAGLDHVVVLPDLAQAQAPLSLEELEAVAGGRGCGTREIDSACGADLGIY